jgi:hypothetical protein
MLSVFLLTHPDGRRAVVAAPSSHVAQATITRELNDPQWNQSTVKVRDLFGTPAVVLAESTLALSVYDAAVDTSGITELDRSLTDEVDHRKRTRRSGRV